MISVQEFRKKVIAMRLADKIVVVTGGGAGIGKAICLRFAEEGAEVIVVDCDAPAGEATVAEITSAGGRASYLACDISNEDDIATLAGDVE
ncbi:MAG: 2-hydroxycyclohexanecarboxyl-CoA dehydrogenase, partial [Planctomyces sp.]|nr:2-hydroxycyclohexanecarboxyl-CoA dehydrogenase [Planctomyces sp.]